MPTVQRVEGDTNINGTLTVKSFVCPAGSIKNASIEAAAGIAASKLQHQHRVPFSQPNTTATAETRVIHRVYGTTGTISSFHAGSIVANAGAATVTVDLKKNGSSVLTSPITLNNSNTARVAVEGTISVTALVAGDVLEVVTTATAGGGTLATGVFASATITEDAE